VTDAPTIRLATLNTTSEVSSLASGCQAVPALLVSFVYLPAFLRVRSQYRYRDWALDSGAYSAHNSGTPIRLADYIATATELRATDATLTDVFSLDVIGDPVASLKNCEAMWAAGVPAIPTFHYGEPEHVLLSMARTYPKIALGGVVHLKTQQRQKRQWAEQCFARTWPKRIHGFSFGGHQAILALPWHSVDATNWEVGPTRWGKWRRYGHLSIRGQHHLQAEINHYLTVEQQARVRWRAQMAELDHLGKERDL